jgi:hypothetical protein
MIPVGINLTSRKFKGGLRDTGGTSKKAKKPKKTFQKRDYRRGSQGHQFSGARQQKIQKDRGIPCPWCVRLEAAQTKNFNDKVTQNCPKTITIQKTDLA